jgi:nanoRNase/pAp phosphatase (c-di-AMP/oligoRNAs hydrolase)
MALTQTQQIHQLLENKKHILITFAKDASGDHIASASALALFLHALGKQVDIVSDEFTLPRAYTFLSEAHTIQPKFSDLQKFIITVDVKEAGVKELSYDVQEQKLRIFVTPKQGFLNQTHVKTAQSNFKYDLIFTVGTPDLASLGCLFEDHTDLFFKTPLINIDYKTTNEQYGQINIVDVTASSTTEVLYGLMKRLGEEHMSEAIATALLTGIIASTRSFKTDNIKPHTLNTASKLMAIGADREQIVQQLYQTRSIGGLKLWGTALSHLHHDVDTGLVWSTLTRDDFVRAGAKEKDLYDIVDELIANSPDARVVLLLHEHSETLNQIHGVIHTKSYIDATRLLPGTETKGNSDRVSFFIENKPLSHAERSVIAAIKHELTKHWPDFQIVSKQF